MFKQNKNAKENQFVNTDMDDLEGGGRTYHYNDNEENDDDNGYGIVQIMSGTCRQNVNQLLIMKLSIRPVSSSLNFIHVLIRWKGKERGQREERQRRKRYIYT